MGEKRAALVPRLDTQYRLHEGRSIWGLRNTLCDNLKPNLGPPSLRLATSRNNKPRITQDIRVQTGKLDEPIISPLLTLTVSPQLAALADLPGTWEMSFWQTQAGPGLPAQLPNKRQIKTHLQICVGDDCVVAVCKMSVFSGGMDLDGGSTLCPCDQPLIVYLSLEGISTPVRTVCEKRWETQGKSSFTKPLNCRSKLLIHKCWTVMMWTCRGLIRCFWKWEAIFFLFFLPAALVVILSVV